MLIKAACATAGLGLGAAAGEVGATDVVDEVGEVVGEAATVVAADPHPETPTISAAAAMVNNPALTLMMWPSCALFVVVGQLHLNEVAAVWFFGYFSAQQARMSVATV